MPREELQLYSGKAQEREVKDSEKQESKKENKQKNGNVVERPKPSKTKTTKRFLGQ